MTARKPRTRRVVTTEEIEDDRPDVAEERRGPVLIEDDPAALQVEDIVDSYGNGALEIKVYRQTGRGFEYCFTGACREDVTEEAIRAHPHGGHGAFQLRFIVNGRYDRSYNVNIAAPRDGVTVSNPQGGVQNEIVRLLMDEVKELKAHILRTSNSQQEPISAVVAAVAQLGAMQAQNAPPWQQVFDAIKYGMEISNSGKEDRGLLSEILGPVAQAAMPLLLGGRGALPPGPPVTTAAVAEPNPGGDMEEQRKADAALVIKLREGINFLKRQCRSQVDALYWVDMIGALAETSDDYGRLVTLILDPAFDLSAFAKQIGDTEIDKPPYREWFSALADGLRQGFSPNDPVANDTGRPRGNNGNAPSNGTTSKGSKRQ